MKKVMIFSIGLVLSGYLCASDPYRRVAEEIVERAAASRKGSPDLLLAEVDSSVGLESDPYRLAAEMIVKGREVSRQTSPTVITASLKNLCDFEVRIDGVWCGVYQNYNPITRNDDYCLDIPRGVKITRRRGLRMGQFHNTYNTGRAIHKFRLRPAVSKS